MNYLLKFKADPKFDDVYVECESLDAAVSYVFEDANELEWALKLSGIHGSINAEDVTRNIIADVNAQMEAAERGEDDEERKPWDWSACQLRSYYQHRM